MRSSGFASEVRKRRAAPTIERWEETESKYIYLFKRPASVLKCFIVVIVVKESGALNDLCARIGVYSFKRGGGNPLAGFVKLTLSVLYTLSRVIKQLLLILEL